MESHSPIAACNVTTVQEIDTMLKAFWDIEEFTQTKSNMSEEQQKCELHFVENTVFEPNGGIKVRLPFKGSINQLGSSFETSRRRFMYLEKRLKNDEVLKGMYIGHMSLVSYENLNKPHYVIPHHPVLRPQSVSTKLRVVFDASVRTSSNISLNDILMVGPTIQKELVTTILCFRLHKFALSADICKMYRQFLVPEADRNFQLILWRDTPYCPINLYQLNTVTYGISAAPFLAIRSLSLISDTYKNEFPIGAQVLKHDLYVDDLLTGSASICELSTKKTEITQILEKAGIALSKWSSNCPELANSIEELPLKPNNENVTKALGMFWKPDKDVFAFGLSAQIFKFQQNDQLYQ